MKKYAYIVDGKVMLSETVKPPSLGQVNSYDSLFEFLKAQNDLKHWEDSLVECDNTGKYKDGTYFVHFPHQPLIVIKDGQAVDADNNTITKIL